MTFDDVGNGGPYTYIYIYSHISIALNNDPEAQDSYKVRIKMAEMSHGNGPWHA